MKKLRLLALGFIPFLLGRLYGQIMMSDWFLFLPPPFLIGLGVLFFWFRLGVRFGGDVKSPIRAVFLLNLPAFWVLVIIGLQELVLKSYWGNFAGIWTQSFYLPLLNLGFLLTRWTHRLLSAYCVAFLLMIAASYCGCKRGRNRILSNNTAPKSEQYHNL